MSHTRDRHHLLYAGLRFLLSTSLFFIVNKQKTTREGGFLPFREDTLTWEGLFYFTTNKKSPCGGFNVQGKELVTAVNALEVKERTICLVAPETIFCLIVLQECD